MPNGLHVYAYLRDQAGLGIDERVVSTQAIIDVPEADALIVLFWIVASRHPDEPDFKIMKS